MPAKQAKPMKPEKTKCEQVVHYFHDKVLPILITALVIGVAIFLFQNSVEQSNLRDQQRVAKQEEGCWEPLVITQSTIMRMSLNFRRNK